MTMMTTVVAIALGLAPVKPDGTVQPIGANEARVIGKFSEIIDDTGTTHLRGVNRSTGELFDLTVNPHGRVEGSVGDWVVTFQVHGLA
jgi:hypothetical protein